jgi:hypothetical protein
MQINYDDWQIKFLETRGDKILCNGRQTGKSEICGKDCGDWAIRHTNKVILMIAPTERQAYALFDKAFNYLYDNYKHMLVLKGKDKPTKVKFCLTNCTEIWCLPVGLSGLGVRFLTIHRLYADEASRINNEVWSAVTPMLVTTGGDTILLSTMFSNEDRFYLTWTNDKGAYNNFARFSIGSEECFRNRKISETWTIQQRDKALQFLASEKLRMTRREYAIEYEAIYIDGLKQFFSSDLIRECMTLDRANPIKRDKRNTASLGSDIARLGGDETAHIGLEMNTLGELTQFEQDNKQDTRLTDVARDILAMDLKSDYNRLFIDDGGLGAGVVDILLETEVRRKVRAINNAKWVFSHEKDHKKLMKEHLYNNLLNLMESGKIKLFKDNDLFISLKSIQAEYVNGKLLIHGRYSHLTEALVRAAWIVKEKGLNLWVYCN